MDNNLTFKLSLQEFMSGAIKQLGSITHSVFGGINQDIAGTQKGLEGLGKPVKIAVDTSSLKSAQGEVNRLDGMLSGLTRYIGMAAIGAGVLEIIKTGAGQQRDITGLSTFLGGQGPATKFYNQVQKDARLTPFVTHDLMSADRMLISTGMSAQEATKDIHNLANAVAAVGGSNYVLERMAMHLQTIKANGSAGAMQLREFSTNGINIYKLLSDYTGKVVRKTEGMKIAYKDIAGALEYAAGKGGLFYGALEAQSTTIFGKWSTFVDDLQNAAGKIVMGQNGGITGIIDKLDEYAQRLPEIVEGMAGAFKTVTGVISDGIGFVGKYAGEIWLGLKALLAWRVISAAASIATGIFAGAVKLSTVINGAFIASEEAAIVATEELNAAMLISPWAVIAAGIGLVAGAFLLMSENEDKAAKPRMLGLNLETKTDSRAEHIRKITGIDENNKKMTESRKVVAAQRSITGMLTGLTAWGSDTTNYPKLNLDAPWSPTAPGNGTNSNASVLPSKQKKRKLLSVADADGADGNAIVGGGQKQIIINVKSFAEHFVVHAGNLKDAAGQSREAFERMFLEVLQSAKAAM